MTMDEIDNYSTNNLINNILYYSLNSDNLRFNEADEHAVKVILYKTLVGEFELDYFNAKDFNILNGETFDKTQNRIRGGKRGKAKGEPCGYVFKRNDVVYRCKDCAMDPTTVFCTRCFHATHPQDDANHPFANHQVSFSLMTAGGCCDCGDPEAWRIDPGRPAYLDEECDNDDFEVPYDGLLRARETIAAVLDFVVYMISTSPKDFIPPNNVPKVKSLSTLRPDTPTDAGPWSVILWNDERHSFDDVIEQVSLALDCSSNQSRLVAENIDRYGREILKSSNDIPSLLKIAILVNAIDLAVTIRPSYDTFLEDICHVIIQFIFDLCHSRPQTLRTIVAEELLKKPSNLSINSEIEGSENLTRLQALLILESRIWKKGRKLFRDTLVALIGVSQQIRCDIGLQFSLVYKQLVELYLLQDHEPELSSLMFSIQVFTTPSVASLICFNDKFEGNSMLSKILYIAYSFLTEQRVKPKEIKMPPVMTNEIIDCDSTAIRHKRYLAVIQDLRTLLTNDGVTDELPNRLDLLEVFIKFFIPFTDMNSFQRAIHEHVEYESDAWINAFNCTIQLTKITHALGEMTNKFQPQQALTLIRRILDGIAETMHRNNFSTKMTNIQFGGYNYNVVDYSVGYQPVSFHHPLHWWLANVLKHVNILGHFYHGGVNTREIPIVFGERSRNNLLPTIAMFEQPLRVCAFIAQARCGLWVRNGFSIRGQVHHYREITFRDNTYDLDLFNLQIMFTIVEPEQALVSLMSKFDMLTWFEGFIYHSIYDEKQANMMAEEFLLLLISCLTEPSNICGYTKDQRIERSIIHALCFGPSSYSEFTRLISDTLVDDPDFDRLLNKVANFRAPDGTTDYGTYELKDENYEKVDPFYMNFTRNMRENANQNLKKYYEAKGKGDNHIHLPKKLELPSNGPYNSIIGVYKTQVLQQIIYSSLYNAFNERDDDGKVVKTFSNDLIIDAALQLILNGLVETKNIFSKFALSKVNLMKGTLVELLSEYENDERLINVKSKITWILNEISDVNKELVDEYRSKYKKDEDLKMNVDKSIEERRSAAKERQAAIMANFANQQKNLLNQLEEDDDDDYEDEDMKLDDDYDYKINEDNDSTPIMEDIKESESDYRNFGDCIVCQESLKGTTFGSLAFIQPSRMLRNTPSLDVKFVYDAFWQSNNLDRAYNCSVDETYKDNFVNSKLNNNNSESNISTPGFPSDHCRLGLNMTSCGHRMHLSCFETYFASSVARHQSQIARTQPDEPKWKEFVCPLCKGLGNVILPVFNRKNKSKTSNSNLKITEWVRSASIDLLKDPKVSLLNDFQEQETGSGEFWPWYARSAPPQKKDDENENELGVNVMIDRLMNLIKPISINAEDLRQTSVPAAQELSTEGMYLPGELVAYTISSMEVSKRLNGNLNTNISDNLNESQVLMIESMLGIMENLASRHPTHDDKGCSIIAKGIFQRILPEFGREDNVRQPLLLRDPLCLLIEIAAVSPESLSPMINLSFYAQLVRIVISLIQMSRTDGVADAPMLRPPQEIEKVPKEVENIFGNVKGMISYMLQSFTALYNDGERMLKILPTSHILKLIYSYLLPFLRRVSILHKVVKDGSKIYTNSDKQRQYVNENDCEFIRLMNELEILKPIDCLNLSNEGQTTIERMVEGWCSHFGHHVQELRPRDYLLKLDYPDIYKLAKLPKKLSTLIDDVLVRVCPNCNQVPPDPALCLLCGSTLCHQSFCCFDQMSRVGECNTHMKKCGGVIGAFFMPKKSATFYLYGIKGSFAQPPYLDAHGEIDIGIKRGKPQYLHKQRLDEIYKIWINHQIPSWIGRKLDAGNDFGGWGLF